MSALETAGLALPKEVVSGIWKKTITGSVVAQLSGGEPQKFGTHDVMTLSGRPKAEYVAESGQKSQSTISFAPKTVVPQKVQVTVRTSREVLIADEDYKLGVLNTIGDELSIALARALDLGVIHRLNPLSGTTVGGITAYLNQTSNRRAITADADLDVEAAAGLVISDGFTPNGIALDSSYAWTLATARYTDGRKKFPELGLGTAVSDFLGLNAAVSDTVSGRPEAADQGVRGIVGDWSALRWGVQREIPLELIKYGDPDGDGDLSRKNQVAIRAEVIYGWAVLDSDAFAVIHTGS